MSRAAKGADCKSAGYAFVGSSPTSPTNRHGFGQPIAEAWTSEALAKAGQIIYMTAGARV